MLDSRPTVYYLAIIDSRKPVWIEYHSLQDKGGLSSVIKKEFDEYSKYDSEFDGNADELLINQVLLSYIQRLH